MDAECDFCQFDNNEEIQPLMSLLHEAGSQLANVGDTYKGVEVWGWVHGGAYKYGRFQNKNYEVEYQEDGTPLRAWIR